MIGTYSYTLILPTTTARFYEVSDVIKTNAYGSTTTLQRIVIITDAQVNCINTLLACDTLIVEVHVWFAFIEQDRSYLLRYKDQNISGEATF